LGPRVERGGIGGGAEAFVAWVRDAPEESLHLSAVTIGELQAGIEITREQDAEKAKEIEEWLDCVAETCNVPGGGRDYLPPLGATHAPSIRS
jgi:hypothetical protein